ncbi:hypothetical protein [Chondromyces apiculatus]|uniref:Uncharacterized protein n=1 Tax=Chondromyces apiculatus DSM 436 TaxID=1192034 RepID=A0A017T9T2_9BACT|nr:hypothetical protein [Chondromyces apiculatus]EYF05999.1 Hypothetical protein CAP_2459 [Chondromyces apiculatus DSM 436]
MDARTYAEAAPAWAERLAEADEGDEGPLETAYEEHLARAQERYARRVLPLAEDLRAWLAFLQCFSSAPDPPALLAQLGLRLQEVARLQRDWGRRLATQPELLREAACAGGGCPRPLPEIVLEAPWPALPEPLDEAALRDLAPHGDEDDDEDDIDEGDEDEGDDDATSVAPPLFVPFEAMESAPRDRATAPAAAALAVAAAAPAKETSEDEDEDERERETLHPLTSTAARRKAAVAVTETQAAPLLTPKLLLPFREDPAALVQFLAAAPPPDLAPLRDRTSEPAWGEGTAAPALVPAGPALPFERPKTAAEAWWEASEPESDPTVQTALAPLVQSGPALPFRPAAPVSQPDLSLGLYASLCAELAVHPKESEQLFRLYGLGDLETRRAVDMAWKARLAQQPELYAAWQDLYRRHLALFVAKRRVLG